MNVHHDEARLTAQLSDLGVQEGGVLMVHASVRAIGPTTGGPTTVVRALRSALGPAGTLTVPTFTPANSDTSPEYVERVRGLDEDAVAELRATMAPFDPAVTPSTMGLLAETVRQTRGAIRSEHPQTSFAALGEEAAKIIEDHHPDCHLGEDSPLARLYDLHAQVLLLGVGFNVCTTFHLAEYRVPRPVRRRYNCVITLDGQRQWWTYEDVALNDGDFGTLGTDFERLSPAGTVRTGRVGSATARLFSLRKAADFAQHWLPEHRPPGS
ncbi:aminoglycoside N(3)-acetyltransferase [Streptomyces sp. NPDC001415]